MQKKIISKEDILQSLYLKHDDAASLLGVSRGTLSKYKKLYGIEVGRGNSQAHNIIHGGGRPRSSFDIEKKCECGKLFVVRSIKKTKTYCSLKCYHKFKNHVVSDEQKDILSQKAKKRWKEPTQAMLDGVEKRKFSDVELINYRKYRNRLANLTEKVYNQFRKEINPNDYVRGVAGQDGAYHLDHIIPARFGFDNAIPPEVLAEKKNLQMLPWRENLKKGAKLDEEICRME